MSEFFAKYPEAYNGDNATIFLNGDGYDKLKDFLSAPTDRLVELLKKSVPVDMYQAMGLLDKSWVDALVGETGVLSSAVERYKKELGELEKAWKQSQKATPELSSSLYRELKQLRCADGDGYNRSLIDFLGCIRKVKNSETYKKKTQIRGKTRAERSDKHESPSL